MSLATEGAPKGEWAANWPVVIVGLLGVTLVTAHIYTTGVMIGPIEKEFGWTRAQISAGQTIMAAVCVFMVPAIGVAIDRFGPRRIALVGCAVYCVALALVSTVTANLSTWWAAWIGLAIGGSIIGPPVWSAAVSSLFVRHRGMALSVLLCGTGIGAGLMPNLANWYVDLFGWRQAYVALGVSWALVMLPAIFFFFSSEADRKRSAGTTAPSPVLNGLTVREGLLSRGYLMLALASGIYTLTISGVVINLVPILVSHGFVRETAASLTALLAVGVVIGRLSTGYLFDRIDAKLVVAVGLGVAIFPALILLTWPASLALSATAVFIYGIVLGPTTSGMAYLATAYVGLRSFGTLFGILVGLLVLLNGIAPLLVSYVYDITHSYWWVLVLAIPGTLLAAILYLLMGPQPDFERPAPAT